MQEKYLRINNTLVYMQHIVSLEKCNSYTQSEVGLSVKKLISNLGGISNFVKIGQKVLLKPNLVKGAAPEECITTHPSIIEAVIKTLKEHGCEVFVGDYPFSGDTIKALKASGIYGVCVRHKAKIAIFHEKIMGKYDKGLVVKEFPLTGYFNDVDAVINLPKLKTHSQLYFTGAVKNLYSMVPGSRRGLYHLKYLNMEFFANMLLDLYGLLRKKVVLNVVDGVYGMEGNGPCNGNPKFAGVLGASSNAIALDYVMCNLVGLDINNLATVHYAKKRKDFQFNEKNIKIAGEKIENIKIEPFVEAEYRTLNMMPTFVNNFKDYIMRHKGELIY